MRGIQVVFVLGFVGVLMFTGMLRLSTIDHSTLSAYAKYATPLYIAATVFFAVAFIRSGVDLNRFGFGVRFRFLHVVMAAFGIALLQVYAVYGSPLLAEVFPDNAGSGIEERFHQVKGSLPDFLSLLAFSWTFAALGEEIAFRIVLMRGLASAMGDGVVAVIAALFIQAIIFGLVHLYKGPIGMTGSMVSGLVFGLLVVLARGAIWPAFLAHGVNNTIGIWEIFTGA